MPSVGTGLGDSQPTITITEPCPCSYFSSLATSYPASKPFYSSSLRFQTLHVNPWSSFNHSLCAYCNTCEPLAIVTVAPVPFYPLWRGPAFIPCLQWASAHLNVPEKVRAEYAWKQHTPFNGRKLLQFGKRAHLFAVMISSSS